MEILHSMSNTIPPAWCLLLRTHHVYYTFITARDFIFMRFRYHGDGSADKERIFASRRRFSLAFMEGVSSAGGSSGVLCGFLETEYDELRLVIILIILFNHERE